jgi:four helix bundle protein
MRDFKRIKAWHRVHALAIALHRRMRRFPRAGYPRLRAQLTGAADSIKDAIAEGCGAATNKEFARFLDMSIKSANETEGCSLSARDSALFSPGEWQKFTAETIELRKMVYRYRSKVIETPDEE